LYVSWADDFFSTCFLLNNFLISSIADDLYRIGWFFVEAGLINLGFFYLFLRVSLRLPEHALVPRLAHLLPMI